MVENPFSYPAAGRLRLSFVYIFKISLRFAGPILLQRTDSLSREPANQYSILKIANSLRPCLLSTAGTNLAAVLGRMHN